MFLKTELMRCPIGRSAESDDSTFIFSVLTCSLVGVVASGCFFEMTERSIIADLLPFRMSYTHHSELTAISAPSGSHGPLDAPFTEQIQLEIVIFAFFLSKGND